MKIGIIARPNQKGQIVIPKKIRDTVGIVPDVPLNIVVQGAGVYLYPIRAVVSNSLGVQSYLKILAKTKGSWSERDWRGYGKQRRREQASTRQRKTAW